ncbi:MAG: efflux RND transporter permease subunit [Bacteroidota bacterium]
MQLPKIAIQNYQFVLIIAIIVFAIGLRSYVEMPRAENPQVDLPIFDVFVAYPGTSPEDMEKLIVNPLEEALNKLEGIDEILSFSEEGIAQVRLLGAFDIDPTEIYDEILRTATEVKADLPDGITYYKTTQFKPADQTAIFQYALTGQDVSYKRLLEQAEKFKAALRKVMGVNQINIEAVPDEEIRISIDFARMNQHHIALQQLVNALAANNTNIPGGKVEAGDKTFSVITSGSYNSLESIKNTVLTAQNGHPVYLKDVAEVSKQYADSRWMARFNGEKAIWINITLKNGTNILHVSKDVKRVATDFSNACPPNIQLKTAFEQAPAVSQKIDEFSTSLWQGMILVGLVIVLFIGFRAASIIVINIPLCILVGLALLNLSGFSLQQFSIAGLILALGLLVDNGIVIIESINHYLKEGLPPKEAAIKGTGDVGYAILSSTLTTILAFYPLTQLGKGAGELIKSLPVIVTLTLLISLVLALTLSPILAGKFMRLKEDRHSRLIDRFTRWLTEKVYRPVLRFCLRHSWLMMGLCILLLAGSLSLFPKIGVSLLPPADKPMVFIEITAPKGTNFQGTDKAVRFVEQVLDTVPFVKNYSSNIGHRNPQVYWNRLSTNFESNEADVLVNFQHWDNELFYNTLAGMRNVFDTYSEANIKIREMKINSISYPIDFSVVGPDPDTLKSLSAKVVQILKTTPGIVNILNPLELNKTGLSVELNRQKAGLIGLSPLTFDQTIRAGLSGLPVGSVSLDDCKDCEMVVRMPVGNKPEIEDLDNLYFTTATGHQVPLRQVADVKFKSLSPQILHQDLERFNSVQADVIRADEAIELTEKIETEITKINLPEGYSIVGKGELAEQEEVFGDLVFIFIIVLCCIFAILVMQFKSFSQPLTIFSAIPFAITGSFIALYLTGWPFSFLAFIGFISLSGIVVNDSILIVDQINQLRKEGMDRLAAIKLGSERRLMPVVLTTLTTILGLIPLAMSQSNLWTPICATIIGGMLSATLMILLVVPVLYKWWAK